MKILAIDTSTARMVAAFIDGENEREIAEGELAGAQTHGEFLAERIRELLDGAKPDLIAVGTGPGPYTGLRVGIATAEVLAYAWNVKIVGVPTLQALAFAHIQTGGGECAAILDVKRREIAWQLFDSAAEPISAAQLSHIDDLTELLKHDLVGPAFITQKLVQPDVLNASPVSAIAIARLAESVRGSQPLPLYLRAPDAADPKPNKSVLGNG